MLFTPNKKAGSVGFWGDGNRWAPASACKAIPNEILLWALWGLGVLYGITLPFSRGDGGEANQIGLVYMAKAGYDPQEAIRFWQRFSKGDGGTA